MNEQLQQHLPKLEELAAEVKDLAWDGDEAKLREEAGRLALSVLVLVKILRTLQRPSLEQDGKSLGELAKATVNCD